MSKISIMEDLRCSQLNNFYTCATSVFNLRIIGLVQLLQLWSCDYQQLYLPEIQDKELNPACIQLPLNSKELKIRVGTKCTFSTFLINTSQAVESVGESKQRGITGKQREFSLSIVRPLKHSAEICSSVEDAHNYFRGEVLYLHMQYA